MRDDDDVDLLLDELTERFAELYLLVRTPTSDVAFDTSAPPPATPPESAAELDLRGAILIGRVVGALLAAVLFLLITAAL